MKYSIVYADPPWQYNDKMSNHGGCEDHYQTMNNKDIAALPVGEIVDRDSVCFMWATSPLLPEALEVMKSWGFKYKTIAFVWNKKTVTGLDVVNMGRWTMGNVEICLLGVKGKPKRIKNNIRQLVSAVRTSHSSKPDEVRERIVELMGDIPRIELFCREEKEGWDSVGNGIDGRDIRDTLGDIIHSNKIIEETGKD